MHGLGLFKFKFNFHKFIKDIFTIRFITFIQSLSYKGSFSVSTMTTEEVNSGSHMSMCTLPSQ